MNPAGKVMPKNVARANAGKSRFRAAVEHVFARQKTRIGLFIRTIGLKRAEAKLTLADIAYNFDRLVLPRAPDSNDHGVSPSAHARKGPNRHRHGREA